MLNYGFELLLPCVMMIELWCSVKLNGTLGAGDCEPTKLYTLQHICYIEPG